MSDVSGKIGSSEQSHARTRGPMGGKLFIRPHHLGGANEGDVWLQLRQVEDYEFDPGVADGKKRYEGIKGVRVPKEAYYGERNPKVKFKLGEQFEPFLMQLGFGADNTPTKSAVAPASSLICAITMQGEKQYGLPVEFNLVQLVANTARTVTGTAFNGSGSIGNGTWYYLVTPVYNGVEGPNLAAAESAVITFATTNDTCQVDWALAAGAAEPDQWKIYRSTTQHSFNTPALLATVDGSLRSYIDGATAPGTGGAPASAATLITVKNSLETVTYDVTDDYVVDYANGTIHRVATGAIGEGETVIITMYFALESGVTFNIDEGRFNSFVMPLMFIGQQSGTRGNTVMVKEVFECVDWTKGASLFAPGKELDDAGLEFDLDVMYDDTNNRFGQRSVYDQAIDDFTVIDLTPA